MSYTIQIICDAEDDILSIYHFVATNDSILKADALLDKIENTINSLCEFPNRGHTPPELATIGIYDYDEIHFKPYRIIYQIEKNNIYIHAVLDGRRDLTTLLEMRLLSK